MRFLAGAVFLTVMACSKKEEPSGQKPPTPQADQCDHDLVIDDAVCGDGVCTVAAGEYCGSCPADCGACEVQSTSGGEFYVSTEGDDSNTGSQVSPFLSIQQGIAVAEPGDTIFVMPGTYSMADLPGADRYAGWETRDDGRGGRSGEAGKPITLRAINPATESAPQFRTVLVGAGEGTETFGITVTETDYIIIDGFEFTNFAVGLILEGGAHLTARRNILRSNVEEGIETLAISDSLIEYNQFLDPGPEYPALDDAIQDYGVAVYEGSTNIAVVHNYFFGKHNQALSFKAMAGPAYAAYNTFEGCMYSCLFLGQNDDEPLEGDQTSFHLTAEHNLFRDAADDGSGADVGAMEGTYYRMRSAIRVRNVCNSTVRYNLVENAIEASVYVQGCDGGEWCETHAGNEPVNASFHHNVFMYSENYLAFELEGRGYENDQITIANNTVLNGSAAISVLGVQFDDNPPFAGTAKVTVQNNNFVNVGQGIIGELERVFSSYNNWYSTDTTTSFPTGNNELHEFPEFKSKPTPWNAQENRGPNPRYTPDFSRASALELQPSSPLIDVGVDVGFDEDFLGAPVSGAPDLGAFEAN